MLSVCCSMAAGEYIPDEPLFQETFDTMTAGEFSLSPVALAEKLINILTGQMQELTYYLVIFFCLGALTSVVNLLGQDFKSRITEVSFFACYTIAASTAVKCFSVCLDYATTVIGDMTDFITKLSPVLATLLITSGRSVSAGAFHPVLAAAVYAVSIICHKCIIPLASYSTVLSIANNISDQVQISGTCRLISSVSKWILALSFTLFTGICGIYGFTAPALDKVSAKTVKFAVGSLVPVVGNFLSDTLETVISGGQMMKNTVGGAGLVVLCTICAVPVIKIGVMALMVRISSALIEPITDKRISGLLSDISNSITILFGMVATTAVLFTICISIILAATGS